LPILVEISPDAPPRPQRWRRGHRQLAPAPSPAAPAASAAVALGSLSLSFAPVVAGLGQSPLTAELLVGGSRGPPASPPRLPGSSTPAVPLSPARRPAAAGRLLPPRGGGSGPTTGDGDDDNDKNYDDDPSAILRPAPKSPESLSSTPTMLPSMARRFPGWPHCPRCRRYRRPRLPRSRRRVGPRTTGRVLTGHSFCHRMRAAPL